MSLPTCPSCGLDYPSQAGQPCDGCEQIFCPSCFEGFEDCEHCGRVFCSGCAPAFIQIPSTVTICNDCYSDYVEDTDFLFDA